jgi:hypothetical protein
MKTSSSSITREWVYSAKSKAFLNQDSHFINSSADPYSGFKYSIPIQEVPLQDAPLKQLGDNTGPGEQQAVSHSAHFPSGERGCVL